MGELRQSKFVRAVNPRPLRIIPLYVDIVDVVYQYRYLTAPQIAAILDRNPDSIKTAVRKLYDNKYLLRPKCQRDPAPWHTSYVYHAISSKGAELLRQERGYIVSNNTYDEKEEQDGIQNWKHDTSLSEFLVKLLEETRKTPYQLLLTRDLAELGILPFPTWKPYNWEQIEWKTGQGRVVPDQVVMFKDPQKTEKNLSLVLIEMDKGTESIDRTKEGSTVKSKIAKYVEVFLSGLHTQTYGVKNMRVAFVTTSRQRIQSMIDITKDAPGFFLFTTYKEALVDPFTWTNNKGQVVKLP